MADQIHQACIESEEVTMTQLYVICGEPGVGKSFVASQIGMSLDDQMVLRTDSIRKQNFGPEPSYDELESQLTYDEMFYHARRYLDQGKNVVLDGTFSLKRGRDRARFIADQHDAEVTIVRVHCPDHETLKDRLSDRTGELSDADWDVYKKIARSFEPVFEDRVDIINDGPYQETASQVRKKVL